MSANAKAIAVPQDYPRALEMISPHTARQHLDRSDGNRECTRETIDAYAHQMLIRAWYLSTDGLMYDVHGRLRNGHHRLYAIIQSGTTQPMYVYTDVPEDVIQCATDKGKPRITAQQLVMDGVPNASQRTAIVRGVVSAARRANIKVTVPLYRQMVPVIGADHLDAVAVLSRRCMPSTLGSALVVARPLNIPLVDTFLERLKDRKFMPGTEAAIARLTARPGAGSLDYIRAYAQGVVWLLEGRQADALQLRRSDGWDRLMSLRAARGLVSVLLPAGYLPDPEDGE